MVFISYKTFLLGFVKRLVRKKVMRKVSKARAKVIVFIEIRDDKNFVKCVEESVVHQIKVEGKEMKGRTEEKVTGGYGGKKTVRGQRARLE